MPLLSILVLAVMVFSLVDIIRRDDFQVKHLPKTMWIIIVILLPIIGSVLWFTLGRVYPEDGPRLPRPSRAAAPAPAPTGARDTRSTEQQLADLEREIEEDRLRDELRRRRRDDPAASA